MELLAISSRFCFAQSLVVFLPFNGGGCFFLGWGGLGLQEGYKATDDDKRAIAKCNSSVGGKYMIGFTCGLLAAAGLIRGTKGVS